MNGKSDWREESKKEEVRVISMSSSLINKIEK